MCCNVSFLYLLYIYAQCCFYINFLEIYTFFKSFIVLHGVVFLQILMVARVMKFCRCFRLSLFRDGRVVSVLVFSLSAPAARSEERRVGKEC